MSDQGSVYAEFINGRLANERERRGKIETRATAVTTTSAALISLIVAALALIVGEKHTFAGESENAVLVALALYALSSGCSLAAGLLRSYTVPDEATLKTALGEHWTDSEVSARLACAWMDLDGLLSLRKVNNSKSRWLDRALWTQLAATVALGVAAAIEVVNLS